MIYHIAVFVCQTRRGHRSLIYLNSTLTLFVDREVFSRVKRANTANAKRTVCSRVSDLQYSRTQTRRKSPNEYSERRLQLLDNEIY